LDGDDLWLRISDKHPAHQHLLNGNGVPIPTICTFIPPCPGRGAAKIIFPASQDGTPSYVATQSRENSTSDAGTHITLYSHLCGTCAFHLHKDSRVRTPHLGKRCKSDVAAWTLIKIRLRRTSAGFSGSIFKLRHAEGSVHRVGPLSGNVLLLRDHGHIAGDALLVSEEFPILTTDVVANPFSVEGSGGGPDITTPDLRIIWLGQDIGGTLEETRRSGGAPRSLVTTGVRHLRTNIVERKVVDASRLVVLDLADVRNDQIMHDRVHRE